MSITNSPVNPQNLSVFEKLTKAFKEPPKELSAQDRLFIKGEGGFEKHLSKEELKEFYNNICWAISAEMDKLKEDGKKATERLRRSQEGKEQDDE